MKKILIILGLIVSACLISTSCGKVEPTAKDSNFKFEYNLTTNDSESIIINQIKTALDELTLLNNKDKIITETDRFIENITTLKQEKIKGTITLYQGSKKIKTWTL